jgi:hypothetical protein
LVISGVQAALVACAIASSACGGPKSEKLPPPSPSVAQSARPLAEADKRPAEPPAPPPSANPANLAQQDIGLDGLRRAGCVVAADAEANGLVAEKCGTGSVLFGPYAAVPAGGQVKVVFIAEAIKGKVTLGADIVGGGGERFYAAGGKFELTPDGAPATIELKTKVHEAETNLETRLWAIPEPAASFRITYARVEIRGPGG